MQIPTHTPVGVRGHTAGPRAPGLPMCMHTHRLADNGAAQGPETLGEGPEAPVSAQMERGQQAEGSEPEPKGGAEPGKTDNTGLGDNSA